jgi:hypothetical protein
MVVVRVVLSVYSTDGTVKERQRSRVDVGEEEDFIKLKKRPK